MAEKKQEGTYYDCIFSPATNKKIDSIIKAMGLTKDFTDAYHCTLTYSKVKKIHLKTSTGMKQHKGGAYKDYNVNNKVNILTKIKSFGHFETPEGRNLHLVLDCDWCVKHHKRSLKEGCTFDYDTYTPHVSLLYNCGDFKLDENEDLWKQFIGTTIHIVKERISPLNLNWVEDSQKKDKDSEKDSEKDEKKEDTKNGLIDD